MVPAMNRTNSKRKESMNDSDTQKVPSFSTRSERKRRNSRETSRSRNQGTQREKTVVAKAEISALEGTPERNNQVEEEPKPGSEVTCRRRIYEKKGAANLGKKKLPMPGKSKRRNDDHKKQTRREPGETFEHRET